MRIIKKQFLSKRRQKQGTRDRVLQQTCGKRSANLILISDRTPCFSSDDEGPCEVGYSSQILLGARRLHRCPAASIPASLTPGRRAKGHTH